MEITIQYFDSCPNWKVVDNRVKELVQQHGLDVSLTYQLIDTPEAAEEYQFAGSPTMLVDGLVLLAPIDRESESMPELTKGVLIFLDEIEAGLDEIGPRHEPRWLFADLR